MSVGRCAERPVGCRGGNERWKREVRGRLAVGGTREGELEERGYMRARVSRDEKKVRSTAWKTLAVR